MKTLKVLAKITVALAAVAGAVYVVATYGNQIVEWCKKLLASLPCCQNDVEIVEEAAEEAAEEVVEAAEEPVAEEVAEEAPAEEPAAEEAPAEEPVAEEKDFEA